MTDTSVRPKPLHPAKFSQPILDVLRRELGKELRMRRGRDLQGCRPLLVLDPFAGVGRVHQLASPPIIQTVGIEIEAEWAACHRDTIHGDAFDWMSARTGYRTTNLYEPGDRPWQRWDPFDAVVTSPTYGNRFSDHHNAQDGSRRRSYTHDLGHDLAPNNSGRMPWGPEYWQFHADAYRLIYRVLRPGGLFLLNVSDFQRDKQLLQAHLFHQGLAMGAGFRWFGKVKIPTDRLQGVGAESTAGRAGHEVLFRFRRPEVGA